MLRPIGTVTVREDQCTRTDKGATVEASDLGWPPGRFPTRVFFVFRTGEARQLPRYRTVETPAGDIAAVVYHDSTGFALEVVNG